jgi:hypothetical protein
MLLYSAAFENTTLTDAAQDILFLATTANVPILIHTINLGASETTDVRARIRILRRTTAGSAGTSITPKAIDERNTRAAVTTVTTMRTTQGTAGDVLDADRWSLLVPWQRIYTPETRIRVAHSGFLAIELVAGTGASRTLSGDVVFEEL